MAVTHTVLSLLYQVRLAVNDLDSTGAITSAGNWLSDNDYNGFIANSGEVQNETSYTFTRRATGLWRVDGFSGNPYALKFASDTAPFTPTGSTGTFVSNCFGSISTTETDTTSTYSVTAARVDFAAIMSDLFFWLAQHRYLQIANQYGAYPGETAKSLMDASGYWAGIRAGQ